MSSLVKDWNTCDKAKDTPESNCIDVVCYGVGNFLSNKVSTQQLTLISALADDLKVILLIHNVIFSLEERGGCMTLY